MVLAPALSVAQEEALRPCVAMSIGGPLGILRAEERLISEPRSAIVRRVLAECQLAVHMNVLRAAPPAFDGDKRIIFAHEPGRAVIEGLGVLFRPPVLQIAPCVIVAA